MLIQDLEDININKEYKVQCEYDYNWNISTYIGLYDGDELITKLKDIDYQEFGFNSSDEMIDTGLLTIEEQ